MRAAFRIPCMAYARFQLKTLSSLLGFYLLLFFLAYRFSNFLTGSLNLEYQLTAYDPIWKRLNASSFAKLENAQFSKHPISKCLSIHILTKFNMTIYSIQFLTTCVRSRLLYSIQACSLAEKELDTIEVIWNGFLRKMVKGGYQRINTPTNKEKQTTTDKEVDWRYRISNDKLRKITKHSPSAPFANVTISNIWDTSVD